MSIKRNNKDSIAGVFGRQLVLLRKKNQLTQAELAESLGMSRTMVSYYESWAKNPTLEAVKKVADYFKVPIETLITEDIVSTKNKVGPVSRLDKQIKQIRSLSAYKQRIVSNLLDGVLKA